MKKVALALTAPFIFASNVFAQSVLQVSPPTTAGGGHIGYSDLGKFISNVLLLAFSMAVIIVLVMLIWGAFEWITSGGDKDAVGKARNRIVNALIGLAVLAVAFALARVAAQFLGFADITTGIPIPTPQ